MSTAFLKVSGLTKSFRGQRVVDGVDMTVGRGRIVGFLGPNGAGKTSIMTMVMGLLCPESGKIELFGAGAQRHPHASAWGICKKSQASTPKCQPGPISRSLHSFTVSRSPAPGRRTFQTESGLPAQLIGRWAAIRAGCSSGPALPASCCMNPNS
jgi:ABC-type branched-subunit amino acid transport system ATPase component